MAGPHVVGIGGTTRPGSSTENAVRFVLARCEKAGATTEHFAGDHLAKLPMYAPERPERAPEAERLVEGLRRADGVVIGSPGYHGTVSGLVKNALDYVEDLSKDDRCYFAGLPVGLVATGTGWQGVVATLVTLRAVTHALRGWPTPMGAGINTSTKVFGEGGVVLDEKARFQLETVADEIMAFSQMQAAQAARV